MGSGISTTGGGQFWWASAIMVAAVGQHRALVALSKDAECVGLHNTSELLCFSPLHMHADKNKQLPA